jgi:hypothetical protein
MKSKLNPSHSKLLRTCGFHNLFLIIHGRSLRRIDGGREGEREPISREKEEKNFASNPRERKIGGK